MANEHENDGAITAADQSFDELDKALAEGDTLRAAQVLRNGDCHPRCALLLLADYLDPEEYPVALIPGKLVLQRRSKGRPPRTQMRRTRTLATKWAVDEEQRHPKVEPEKWPNGKPRGVAIEDVAARKKRSISSIKADLAAANKKG